MLASFFKTIIKKASFEDIQYAINCPEKYIIINTLPVNEQSCLISNTVSCQEEEKLLNDMLSTYDFRNKYIIIYGKNSIDTTAENKYNQIKSLGFMNVLLYSGGLFEWLLLQDIYGKDEFSTTSYTLDILRYKPSNSLSKLLL
jgi:hypothetical protein|tara:strand:+ start:239 stop:667 length:429 start_codon:yes stop_codon:yes gene_type:complete